MNEIAKMIYDRTAYAAEGYDDPLKIWIMLNEVSKAVEDCKKSLRDLAVSEAEKYGKRFEHNGYEFKIQETGTKYNFENCGDPVWQSYKQSALSVSEKVKERETFLKSLKKSVTIVNDETGEVSEIQPPVKTSTTNLVLTPIKQTA